MSKWQPIETAPKDGTVILAYWPFHASTAKLNLDDYPVEDYGEGSAIHETFFCGYTDADLFDSIFEPLDDKTIKHGFWRFMSRTIDAEWTDPAQTGFEGGMWDDEGPTHWMPLPAPPENKS